MTSLLAWHARRRLRPLRGDDSGFTLLEAVVSLMVATVAFTALAAEVGADRVEFYTGPYAHPGANTAAELEKLKAAAAACRKAGLRAARGGAGLGMNAGHDLTLDNLPALKQAIPDLDECSIGHAVTADALIYGFAETVRRYVAILR